MKAMILAAGRGERLRPLTDMTPKPLIQVGGGTLIDKHLERLADAGIEDVIVNVAWRADQIEDYLGDGQRYGLRITYSREPEGALETAGGIRHALDLLGPEPFLVISGDILTHFPVLPLLATPLAGLARLVLVDNPDHNPEGDFGLDAQGQVSRRSQPRLTYSGIGLYHPDLFRELDDGQSIPLREPLGRAVEQGQVSGLHYKGLWLDVGTPERLASARFLASLSVND